MTGVPASEKAAQDHSVRLKLYNLKANFERLGVNKQLPPALLAGKGSRESGFGTTTVHKGIYTGWGDYGIRKKKGEKVATYHGFGILQIDRVECGIPEVARELTNSLGKKKLDPFDYKWLEIGANIFLTKLKGAGITNFIGATPVEFATALSRYNGGGRTYPNSDIGTTGSDYGNDTLVRARWFAQNWENI